MNLNWALLLLIFAVVCGCDQSSTDVAGTSNSAECDFVFGGSWNIYENPKYCITQDRLITNNSDLATNCVWYVENSCDPENDEGCTVAPEDLTPRQNLCETFQCTARLRVFESANSKYDWSYFEVCKMAHEEFSYN